MAQNYNMNSRTFPSFCSVCGPNINTDDVPFGQTEANLVYMDKVYSYNKTTACPILEIIPAGTEWVTEIILKAGESGGECSCESCRGGCNGCNNHNCVCCCNCGGSSSDITLTPDAVFTVARSYVLVNSVELADGTLTAADVTVDGIAVDTLDQAGNRYVATTGNLITQTNRERCQELGLPSKNFFLITGAGPWTFRGTVVLEGTVNTGGRTVCFQTRFTTPDVGIAVTGESTFAVRKLALPCSVNGVSPTIGFGFTGQAYVLNPTITAVAGEGGTVTLTLAGSLALQPQLNIEVVRRTLFCLNACEAMLPCDGTEAAYAFEATEEDCEWPPAPACRCGTAVTPANNPDLCDTSLQCNFDNNCGCNPEETRPHAPDAYQWMGCSGCSW